MSTVKFKLRMVKFLEDPLTDSTPNKYAKEFTDYACNSIGRVCGEAAAQVGKRVPVRGE